MILNLITILILKPVVMDVILGFIGTMRRMHTLKYLQRRNIFVITPSVF